MSNVIFIGNQIWCPLCHGYENFLKIRKAAPLADVSRRTIYRYLEEGKICSVKIAGGTSRVCRGCLIKQNLEDFA